MGNYRFRLSDMIPNAWFYKLKDMNNKTKNPSTTLHHHKKPPYSSSYYHSSPSSTTTPPPHNYHHFSRNSLYYTPRPPTSHFPNSPKSPTHPPLKPSKRLTPNRKTIYKPSQNHTSQSPSTESTHSRLSSCTCAFQLLDHDHDLDLDLPPILTKPAQPTNLNQPRKSTGNANKVDKVNVTPARKSTSGVRVKVRVNSPKLALSKSKGRRKSEKVSDQKCVERKKMNAGFAIVKSSFDPFKDFLESMMEMIVENEIRESKELEELLACYLSLNAEEYHGVIVKAFEQIWFSLSDP